MSCQEGTSLDTVEDERAVARLVASYGPLVDSGSAGQVAALLLGPR
ncbi:hypothetical protein ACIQNU_32335 [Streptomyces sp. NPDC091292]